jgi:hypothetical protein
MRRAGVGAAVATHDFGRAAALYTGAFLDGFFLEEAAEFELWADEERARIEDNQITRQSSRADRRPDRPLSYGNCFCRRSSIDSPTSPASRSTSERSFSWRVLLTDRKSNVATPNDAAITVPHRPSAMATGV